MSGVYSCHTINDFEKSEYTYTNLSEIHSEFYDL